MKIVNRIVLLSLLASVGASAPAAASVLCVKEKKSKPKGKLQVRADECREGEVEVDLADFGVGARIDALESRVAAQQAVIDSQAEELAAQASDLADLADLTDLLAPRQNHAEERATINDFAEAEFTEMVALETDAPTDGFLMLWATLNAEYDFNSEGGANVDLDCRISVDGAASSIVVDQEFARVEGGTNSGESMAVQTVVPVNRGARSAALECRTTGAGMVFVKARALTSLFVTLEGDAPSVRPIPLPRPLPNPLPRPLPRPIGTLSAASVGLDTLND